MKPRASCQIRPPMRWNAAHAGQRRGYRSSVTAPAKSTSASLPTSPLRCFRGDYAAAPIGGPVGPLRRPSPARTPATRKIAPATPQRHGSSNAAQPPGHGRTPHNQRRATPQAPTATRLIAATPSPRFKNAQAGSRYVGHHGAQAARPHRRTRPTTPKTGRAPLKKKNPADTQAGKQSPSVGDYGNSFESAWRP